MAKSKRKTNSKNLDLSKRIALLIVGFIGSSFLIVYSLRWESLGIEVNTVGINITQWFFAGLLVILGIIFATLLKSGLLGKWKLD